jgi:hypothetical protein
MLSVPFAQARSAIRGQLFLNPYSDFKKLIDSVLLRKEAPLLQ